MGVLSLYVITVWHRAHRYSLISRTYWTQGWTNLFFDGSYFEIPEWLLDHSEVQNNHTMMTYSDVIAFAFYHLWLTVCHIDNHSEIDCTNDTDHCNQDLSKNDTDAPFDQFHEMPTMCPCGYNYHFICLSPVSVPCFHSNKNTHCKFLVVVMATRYWMLNLTRPQKM